MKIYEGKRINPRDTWLGEYVVTINNAPLQNPKPAEGDFSWGYIATVMLRDRARWLRN